MKFGEFMSVLSYSACAVTLSCFWTL